MRIIIESIPHTSQRYPTCGDWFYSQDGTLCIKVSEEMGEDSCLLVALHELLEAKMLAKRGVTVEEVDKFDTEYEKAHREGGTLDGERLDESEPGDDFGAPYFEEHQTAQSFENLAARVLDINWAEHAKRVEALP